MRRRVRWKVNTNKTFAGEDDHLVVTYCLMASTNNLKIMFSRFYQESNLTYHKLGTVYPKNFAKILFSLIALEDILAMLKIRHWGMIYLYQLLTEWFLCFARIIFSWNFAYAKFRKNITLVKISQFTVFWYFLFTNQEVLGLHSKYSLV